MSLIKCNKSPRRTQLTAPRKTDEPFSSRQGVQGNTTKEEEEGVACVRACVRACVQRFIISERFFRSVEGKGGKRVIQIFFVWPHRKKSFWTTDRTKMNSSFFSFFSIQFFPLLSSCGNFFRCFGREKNVPLEKRADATHWWWPLFSDAEISTRLGYYYGTLGCLGCFNGGIRQSALSEHAERGFQRVSLKILET